MPKRPIPNWLPKTKVEAVIARAPNGAARIAFQIMWRGGLRPGEVVGNRRAKFPALAWRDVQLDADMGTIDVRHGKGDKARAVPLHSDLKAALIAWRDYRDAPRAGAGAIVVQRNGSVPTYKTLNAWTHRAVRKAIADGILPADREFTPHSFRHSAARHWVDEGVPLPRVQEWLGHASLLETQRYVELLAPDTAGHMEKVS